MHIERVVLQLKKHQELQQRILLQHYQQQQQCLAEQHEQQLRHHLKVSASRARSNLSTPCAMRTEPLRPGRTTERKGTLADWFPCYSNGKCSRSSWRNSARETRKNAWKRWEGKTSTSKALSHPQASRKNCRYIPLLSIQDFLMTLCRCGCQCSPADFFINTHYWNFFFF